MRGAFPPEQRSNNYQVRYELYVSIKNFGAALILGNVECIIRVPELQPGPAHYVSITDAAASKHLVLEVIGLMLARDNFSLGRHQMGKHYNLAAISA